MDCRALPADRHISSTGESERASLGFLGATGVGVGAIVGGGILALAGVAFAATGPGAIVAFALNGAIALLTALSFAELSSAFPQSGGTYVFAKRVLSVRAAFMVGWVVWLASIVAAVLYALGFAAYAATAIASLWAVSIGPPPEWLATRVTLVSFALGATAFYATTLALRSVGGGQWATVGKLVMFSVLLAGGATAFSGRSLASVGTSLRPFFPGGATGLFEAMGYTFIALQGFDLIAAVAGEVRDPRRTVPRAMFASLGIALAVYLPLLFVIATVGVAPGESIGAASRARPEEVIALGALRFMGPFGYWLVVAAAILSMLSALQANLFAASRMVLAMSRDQTLPGVLGRISVSRGTPAVAVVASAFTIGAILLLIPDVASAGAVSSLVFLVAFTSAHSIAIVARRRGSSGPFRLPWFPAIPVAGGLACAALAIFQGFAVPVAGLLASAWLGVGVALYLLLFARRAAVVDAAAEALDPDLVRLRGRTPLVLTPIANPTSAEGLMAVADALAPPRVGKVLLLTVVDPSEPGPRLVDAARDVLRVALAPESAERWPEVLTTVARDPWAEIARVVRVHRCESLLLGLGSIGGERVGAELEDLLARVDSDVVILRAGAGWRLEDARRVLVPVGGRRDHSRLRARLLGSLSRTASREISFLGVIPQGAGRESYERARRELRQLAHDEVPGRAEVEIVRGASVPDAIAARTSASDLIVLGLQRLGRRRAFGRVALEIARRTDGPLVLIARGGRQAGREPRVPYGS